MRKRVLRQNTNWRRGMTYLVVGAMFALSLGSGCSAVQTVPTLTRGLLVVDCQPSDATIYIDGKDMGLVSGWRANTVPLEPGAHRVELTRSGYLPYRFDIKVEANRSYTLNLDLIRDLRNLDDLDGPAEAPYPSVDPGSAVPLPDL